jgi:hypothetical protein
MPEFRIAPLHATSQVRAALSEILIEAVASGGSVSFMHPLALETGGQFLAGFAGCGRSGRADRSRRV